MAKVPSKKLAKVSLRGDVLKRGVTFMKVPLPHFERKILKNLNWLNV